MTAPCLPPKKRPAPITFDPPAHACDSHAHVFGPFAQFPLLPARQYTPPEAAPEQFIEHLAALGLARGVVVMATCQDNASVVAAVRRHPDRLRGIVVLEGRTTTADLRTWHAAGVRGVRLNLFNGDIEQELRRAEAHRQTLVELEWHVQLWVSAPTLMDVSPRLQRLGVPIVVDHMGRMPADQAVASAGFRFLCRLLGEGAAWAKISGADRNTVVGSPYEDVDPLIKRLVEANPDQLVWGSDWPHIKYYQDQDMPDDGALLQVVGRCIPEAAIRTKVLAANPARLYGFPP